MCVCFYLTLSYIGTPHEYIKIIYFVFLNYTAHHVDACSYTIPMSEILPEPYCKHNILYYYDLYYNEISNLAGGALYIYRYIILYNYNIFSNIIPSIMYKYILFIDTILYQLSLISKSDRNIYIKFSYIPVIEYIIWFVHNIIIIVQ